MVAGIEGPRFSGAQFVQHAVFGVVWRKTEFFCLGLQRPPPRMDIYTVLAYEGGISRQLITIIVVGNISLAGIKLE